MNITFDWAGVPLKADIVWEDDEIEIETLTCFGTDAGFLLDSIHEQGIYDAAYPAAQAACMRLAQEALCERAADRRYHREEVYG